MHFANAAKFARTPGRVCRGGRRGRSLSGGSGDRAVVTALAFDAVSTGVLYVGFGTGEVMVRAPGSVAVAIDGSFSSYRLWKRLSNFAGGAQIRSSVNMRLSVPPLG